jgi:uncharacterized protein (DUF736 family)
MQERDRFDLAGATHEKLPQATIPRLRIRAFSRRRPLLVDALCRFRAHAFPPSGDGWRTAGLRGVAIAVLVARVYRRRPPLRSGPPAGASSIAFGLEIAIEAAVVAGSKQLRRSDMANIGSFKKSGSEFQGEIITLSVQTKGVRIVPDTTRGNDNAPSHRVYVGRAEIGAAWSKRSTEGRDYLSVKLDDPSFNAPIYANLFDDAPAPFCGPKRCRHVGGTSRNDMRSRRDCQARR